MPPVIIATDYAALADAEDLTTKLGVFEPEFVGFKIPHWHDQKLRFIEDLLDDGRYVVLDSHISNALDKMALSMHAYLEADDPAENENYPRPHAITLNPIPSKTSLMAPEIKATVTSVARKYGVKLIGFSEQIDHLGGTEGAVMTEINRLMNARDLGFEGFEVHAANLINPMFLEQLSLFMIGRTRNSEQRVQFADFISPDWPDLIASKFDVTSIKPYHTLESTTEKKPTTHDELSPEEHLRRSIRVAGHIFGLGVHAVYLGSSVTTARDPVRVVESVLEIRERAMQMSAADNLQAIYEARLQLSALA